MGLTVAFEVDCEALPFVEVARTVPTARLTVRMRPHADTHTPFIVRVREGPVDAVTDAFESVAFVGEYERLGTADGRPRYQVIPAFGFEEWLGDHVDDLDGLRSLASEDATMDRIEVTPEGWLYDGWFADREVFDAFREFWQDEGHSFTLYRLARDDRDGAAGSGDPTGGLTGPQREALLTAREMGYFDVPRRASLAEVATELDITRRRSPSGCAGHSPTSSTHTSTPSPALGAALPVTAKGAVTETRTGPGARTGDLNRRTTESVA